MKTIKLSIFALLMAAFVCRASANNTIGLYLSQKDYREHKLSYVADGTNSTTVRLHSFFGSHQVVVIQNGKKEYFSKDKIFGYQMNGQDYRYFNHCAYRIIDTTGFYLYVYYKLEQQGKAPKRVEQYYFSPKANDDIKLLTIDNLQSAFTNKTRFVYTVKGFFKSDNELADYDAILKQYKLKHIYVETFK